MEKKKTLEKRQKSSEHLRKALAECNVKSVDVVRWIVKVDSTASPKDSFQKQFSDMTTGRRSVSEHYAKLIAIYMNSVHAPQVAPTSTHPYWSIDYYDYRYFTGEFDNENWYIEFNQKESFLNSEIDAFQIVFKRFLREFGYEILSPEYFVPCFDYTDYGKDSLLHSKEDCIQFFNQTRQNREHYMRLRQISTGKEIELSFIDAQVLFDTIFRTAGTLIDSLFLRESIPAANTKHETTDNEMS